MRNDTIKETISYMVASSKIPITCVRHIQHSPISTHSMHFLGTQYTTHLYSILDECVKIEPLPEQAVLVLPLIIVSIRVHQQTYPIRAWQEHIAIPTHPSSGAIPEPRLRLALECLFNNGIGILGWCDRLCERVSLNRNWQPFHLLGTLCTWFLKFSAKGKYSESVQQLG